MKFNNKFPFAKWGKDENITVPDNELVGTGFTEGYQPPAPYFNWMWNMLVQSITEMQNKIIPTISIADMDYIQEKERIGIYEVIDIPDDGGFSDFRGFLFVTDRSYGYSTQYLVGAEGYPKRDEITGNFIDGGIIRIRHNIGNTKWTEWETITLTQKDREAMIIDVNIEVDEISSFIHEHITGAEPYDVNGNKTTVIDEIHNGIYRINVTDATGYTICKLMSQIVRKENENICYIEQTMIDAGQMNYQRVLQINGATYKVFQEWWSEFNTTEAANNKLAAITEDYEKESTDFYPSVKAMVDYVVDYCDERTIVGSYVGDGEAQNTRFNLLMFKPLKVEIVPATPGNYSVTTLVQGCPYSSILRSQNEAYGISVRWTDTGVSMTPYTTGLGNIDAATVVCNTEGVTYHYIIHRR